MSRLSIVITAVFCTVALAVAQPPAFDCDFDELSMDVSQAANDYRAAIDEPEVSKEFKDQLESEFRFCGPQLDADIKNTVGSFHRDDELNELVGDVDRAKTETDNGVASGIVSFIEHHQNGNVEFRDAFENTVELCQDFVDRVWKIVEIYSIKSDILKQQLDPAETDLLAKSGVCTKIYSTMYKRFELYELARALWFQKHPSGESMTDDLDDSAISGLQ